MAISSQLQRQPLPSDLPFRIISGTIGQGAYAFIRKAAPKNAFKPVIAVKFINKEHAYKLGKVKPKNIQAEIALHNHVGQHHNVIEYLTSGEDEYWTWVAMELASGDLFDKIEADVGLTEDVAHFYFTQLISAVSFMHSKSVAHRDIKPENILLAEGELKLADFGLAVLFAHKGQTKPCQTVCGSPPYMAPEVVPKEGFTGRKTAPYAGDVADIWSCGIVLFVLFVGNTPWDEPTMQSEEFKDYIQSDCAPSDELWLKIPQQARSLLRGVLRPDPKTRMSLEEVRRHPWFTRPNAYLTPDGRAANPIGLATQMLESLHIDFQADPFASSQRQPRAPLNDDAMDVDGQEAGRIALTQPETPVAEVAFDWERPKVRSASQPMPGMNGADMGSSRLALDPTMSQFSATPAIPLSLTQQAKRFHDIVPNHSLTRFLSFMDFNLLLPLICEALDRLAIHTRAENSVVADETGKASIPIKTRDQRNLQLLGWIIVERIEDEVLEVRFTKIKGDPLEWRRLFKKVAILCKDAILRPDE